jgi:sortase A
MPDHEDPSTLSDEELRRLLVEKRRSDRQARLERFRKTGRVVSLSYNEDSGLGSLRSSGIDAEGISSRRAPRSRRRKLLDALLLLVEVGAVVGLFFILFNGMNIVRQLNQEVMAAIEQPTMTPTPLISAVVLPSGHTPPNAEGGARQHPDSHPRPGACDPDPNPSLGDQCPGCPGRRLGAA